ncbi:enoyl-CoA hydratase/isomerase family protein [Rubrivirga marina]|uniref:Methylglutaconyl-CoA hydratase n=1 Tax=Rubrivirga marina TaxID=1196024 RepID=A0A271J0D8_9BACT|nr:enoyl-CoA hydratase-related protein [Rubrivirga marina]PAP76777.1 methylglutaconyl-CoA hydratase [Rubrivirga marina]
MLQVSRAGSILTLTLDRPEVRNALSAELVGRLTDALVEAGGDDSVRVVVLTGTGRAFSAGADLAALQALSTASAEANLTDSETLARLFETIYTLPKPVVAKVQGHAIAGGCGLAAVCDISIAADGVKLGFTETRIGFVPAIVSVFLVRKLGEADARNLLLRGHLIDADEAERIGLVTRAVAPDDLDEATDALCLELATETSASAIALTKRLLADVPSLGIAEGLSYAARLNALARATDDCRAGVAAFLDKEDPPWKRGQSA